MTKKVLDALPQNIRDAVKDYKVYYKRDDRFKDDYKNEMLGYVKALRDAKIITERERQILYVYMTV